MYCPSCGTQNETGFQFCMKCGTPLAKSAPAEVTAAELQTTPAVSQAYTPSPLTAQPRPKPVAKPSPFQVGLPPPPSRTHVGGESLSIVGIWRPFAGYGTRRRHTGWLMDNQEALAQELSTKITQKFNERTIPDTLVEKKNLVGRGMIVETRPYFLVRRGLVTVGLYVAQVGKDVFVSLASYLKPPISNVRLILLAGMVLFAFYTLFIFPNSLAEAVEGLLGGFLSFGGRPETSTNLGTLLCITGPLGTLNLLALSLFIIYSLYKFVTEKDILAGLRVSPNEFNEDDLMAVEKAVEQTVRISLDEIGLNADDLKPIAVDDSRRLI
jgi:hypothetical protein